ncbi:PAAR domain-containing protein [Lysinibacillus sp. NPDC048646]|uniref:PAAR domain-containing protein n=1 Tax=Lysinibacillus sp. NPDC048646 TaxID=3390574 RepID=UPI003D091845
MPEVSVKGNKIQNSTATGHIKVKKPNEYTCEAGYMNGEFYSGYWSGGICYGVLTPPSSSHSYDYISATIEGQINEGSSNVFVNGKEAVYSGAKTSEKDTYSVPSGWSYDSGSHTSATGSVTGGSSTVFVNGKPLARKSDKVTTHGGSTPTISEGSSNVFSG